MARIWIAIDGKKKVWKLPEKGVVIGGEGSQLKLEDGEVAPRHCRIEKKNDDWMVSLLSGGNSMLVNGHAETEAVLGSGDVVTIGTTELNFELAEEAVAKPAAAKPAKPASTRRSGGGSRRSSAGAGAGGGGTSRSRSRRGREEEEPEEGRQSARRGRYRQQQGLPGWATGIIIVGALGILGLLLSNIMGGLSPEARFLLEKAESMAQQGRWDEAYAALDEVAPAAPAEAAKIRARVDQLKEQSDKASHRMQLENYYHARIEKYEASGPVRAHKPINVFSLLIRCRLYKRMYPDSHRNKDVERIEQQYANVIDMDNPEPGWLVTAVHEPYWKSQHHKRFNLSYAVLDECRTMYGSKYPDVITKLKEQNDMFANMFGEREVGDARKLIQGGETFMPKINEQINNVKLMIKYVKLPQWIEEGKKALVELQDYRDKVAKNR